ncbi:MAG: glutamyl-tRNA reductase, partial [Cyclobacteriaceae bacterium]|nr:glutamyl-tRNA reductase [Cyclobacteriaceae bacterium]
MNNFKALTLSFNYAPVAVREKVVMGEESTKRLLQVFRDVLDVHEALIVSTCNRTEIYYASYEDLNSRVLDCIKVVLGAEVEDCFPYFKKHTNHDEVIKRLFEVSIGLHS